MLNINGELKELFPDLVLGVLSAKVNVGKSSSSLCELIDKESSDLIGGLDVEMLSDIAGIKHLRDAYKKLGKSPSRYRGSAEALLRRLLNGKGLYRVNNVVDINNLVSVRSKHAVGSYDIDSINFPAEFRIGRVGEEYKGIGKENVNISSLPVFSDINGPYGSPTSDSEKAMITENTNNIMMVVISFSGRSSIESDLEFAKDLLCKYAGGYDFSMVVVG